MPEIVVPDNLKAGIKHPCRYEPDLNPTYHDLAEHYVAVICSANAIAAEQRNVVHFFARLVFTPRSVAEHSPTSRVL